MLYVVGFPRDGTSRDKPGQTGKGRPVVPLSRDKQIFLSRCPFVPGQGQEQMSRDKHLCPGTSRDKITFPKEHKKQEKDVPKQENDQISCFRTSFSCFRTSFPVLEHPFPVLEHPFLLCPVLSRVPSRILAVPARPVADFSCPGPSHPLARFWACPVVHLSRDHKGTSVPFSRKLALSCPVGNPNF